MPMRAPDKSYVDELIRDNLVEIADIKSELNNLKHHANLIKQNEQPGSAFSRSKIVHNLEAQITTLKEELQAEFELRTKLEDEVSRLQEQLFVTGGNPDERTYPVQGDIHRHDKSKTNSNSRSSDAKLVTKNNNKNGTDYPDNPEELKIKLSELQLLYDDEHDRLRELQQAHSALQKKYSVCCKTTNEAFEKIEATLKLAQSATEERDQAIVNLNLVSTELNRLRTVIESLVEETGKRTSEEVAKVRDQANANIAKLLEDLHAVEQDRSKIAMELERMKSSANSGLNLGEPSVPPQQLDLRLEQALQRAHQAEQERDEWRLKFETTKLAHERNLASKDHELMHLKDDHEILKRHVDQLEKSRAILEERFNKQKESLNQLEKQANDMRHEAESAQRSAMHQVLQAHQELELRDSELRRRLEANEKANEASAQRWQELLSKQKELTSKWKSEAQLLAQQLEQQGIAFEAELERERKQVKHLTQRLMEQECELNAKL